MEQAKEFDEAQRYDYLNRLVQRAIEEGVDVWEVENQEIGVEDDAKEGQRKKCRTLGVGKRVDADPIALPNFREWENWGVSVHPKRKSDSHELSYARVKYRLKRHMEACHMTGINQPVTHGGRKHGTLVLCAAGIPEDVIRHVGRWMWGIFNRVYAAKLLPQPLLTQAGFRDSAGLMRYKLCRGRVKVPEELKKMVFPWVEEYRWEVRKVRSITVAVS